MKTQYIILCIVIFKVAIAAVCDKKQSLKIYSCEKKLKDDKCYMKENGSTDKATIIHVRDICGKDEICEEDGWNFCYKREYIKTEGESCVINPECLSGICTDGKCIGIAENTKCLSTAQCKANLYCKMVLGEGTCTKLVEKDGECSEDSDCVFNYACSASTQGGTKHCIEMFSLDTGAVASNPYVCKSGLLHDSGLAFKLLEKNTDLVSSWKCAESTLNGEGKCTTEEDCSYAVGSNTVTGKSSPSTGFCKCDGKGVQGYCMLGSKSDQVVKFIEQYASEVKDITVDENFNTPYLRNKVWGIPKLYQAMRDISNYQTLQNVDKCAIKYITGSNMMTISGLLLLITFALY